MKRFTLFTFLFLAVASLAAQTRSGAKAPAPAQTGRSAAPAGAAVKPSPGAGPIIVWETVKGTFEMETYPNEAPKSVEHILTLVRRRFYNGLRIHRVEPRELVQFGDPLTRDMSKSDRWGTGGSGKPMGVAEMSPKRKFVVGAVGMAHPGDPRFADSQLFVMMIPQPKYDNHYTVVGRVISGMDVIQKLQKNDVIRTVTVRESK